MGKAAKKKRGRPTKAPKAGDRVSLGLRVTAQIKRRLDAAAERTGRSQSQEAELRLEQSFRQDDLFSDPALRDMALLMATAFATAGKIATGKKTSEWIADQSAYRRAMFGVIRALYANWQNATDEDIALEIESLKGWLLSDIANRRPQQ